MITLINIAQASDAVGAAAQQPSMWASLLPMVLIMAVFYVFLIRPSQQKMKEHHKLVASLSKGDSVVTSGGIFGSVVSIDAESGIMSLEIADGVRVRVKKEMVTEVIEAKGVKVAKEDKGVKKLEKPSKKTK
jgi:preprotein translocase subunit YajC